MIVVTGGAGFIGSAIVWALNQKGIDDIIIVDSLKKTDKWKNLRSLKYADYIEKEDFLYFLDKDLLPSNISKIIHMGACSSTWEDDASYLSQNNFTFTKILAEYCIENSIRFLYASSAATYGMGEKGFDDDITKLQELRPLNMYGYSKQMFDMYSKKHNYFDKIVGLKFFNVFGPNEYHKGNMTSKMYKSFFEINDTKKIQLFKSDHPEWKDGDFVRDFVYIKDVVKIVLEILENPNVNGLFNIGTAKSRSWNDLANAMFKSMDIAPNIEYIDMFDHLKGKYQYFTEANMNTLKTACIDIECMSLEDSIKDYVKNYLIPNKYLGDE
ncbi:MAG: ADP-glyceromanno-heptose 6-epimerase [Candidatus Delongbacteria bacterium]|jgi:ADP-L-glycero-D-manno-heptose 6-epimerase|nr:ADP-glyceromanno-heptose 6-epimerase [Candidatus Delongbacteria bacterium]